MVLLTWASYTQRYFTSELSKATFLNFRRTESTEQFGRWCKFLPQPRNLNVLFLLFLWLEWSSDLQNALKDSLEPTGSSFLRAPRQQLSSSPLLKGIGENVSPPAPQRAVSSALRAAVLTAGLLHGTWPLQCPSSESIPLPGVKTAGKSPGMLSRLHPSVRPSSRLHP